MAMARDATAGHTMPEGFGAVRDLAIACIRDEKMDRLTGWPSRVGAFREEPMTTENLSNEIGHPENLEAAPEEDRRIVLTRILNAPRALVWKAWTTPVHIVRWWGPKGFQSTDCEIDLRVGGTFRLAMHGPDGTVYPCCGVFTEITPPERLVYEGDAHREEACGAGLPPRARVTVTFDEEGGKTRLTLETRFDSVAACRAAEESGVVPGWNDTFDRLAGELATM
ncbi:MAG: SRPBCC family protein [Hyphomicrobiales bacterium]|nr:SRPBCC family protein [Hyphomicrobiales bacterium]